MILFVRSSIRYNYQIHPYIIQTMLFSPYCDTKTPSKPPTMAPSPTGELEVPEPPTTCCMSGCANCVWIEYAEKLTKIFHDGGERAQKEIMDKVQDSNMHAFLSMEIRTIKLRENASKDKK